MTALVDPDGLAALLARGEPDVVLLDVQWELGGRPGRELYAEAHLPEARFVDLDVDLADPPGIGGRHPLPGPSRLQDSLRRLGIHDSTTVVAYDQGSSLAAARAWWLLGYVGLRDVRVLDGGLAAWQRSGREVTTRVPGPAIPGTITVHPGARPVLDAAGAARVARSGLLLDARARERFEGRTEPIDAVAGHIPGAHNTPMADYVGPDGRFLDPEHLHAYFAARGVFDRGEVGAYCGSGITAAHLALALRRVGILAPVYVGSWSEWITDPARPIATGPQD
ncbi:MAG: sulfurtransferase [Tetrasphaera sp.]|nr:sulfurtransferase [Tetrasphaera sp.]